MQPNTQEAPGYFLWQPPGKAYVVHLSLDVVDRLNADVMRGFGAVPKRGAEVGGVLLGSIEYGETCVIRVDDFEIVPCEYRRGPSYYLSEPEMGALAAAAGNERAVGYYRSHTRDGAMALGAEDLDVMASLFPDGGQIALLVKPFATKVNQAGIFVREGEVFPGETPEFPFRRREMLGEEAPARRSMYERKPRNRERREPEPESGYESVPPGYSFDSRPEPAYTEESLAPPPHAPKSAWVWLPLALIFLVLGAALGYQLTVTFVPGMRASEGAEGFKLGLAAVRSGNSLTVRWNREAPAVQAAQRGVLEISDGELTKSVALDAAHLKEGSVVYQPSSALVHFHLVVFISSSVTVNETADWKQ